VAEESSRALRQPEDMRADVPWDGQRIGKEDDELTTHCTRRGWKAWPLIVFPWVLLLWPVSAAARAAGELVAQKRGVISAPTPKPPAGNGARSTGAANVATVPSPPAVQSQLEKNPSLDIAQRYALEHNPAIRSAYHAWQAAEQRITQERSYENPMVMYMPDTQNMAETRAGPQTNGFGVSQVIPFPGKLTLRGKIADQQALAVLENLAAVTQETLRKVWVAYAQFYFAEKALNVNAESTALARQF
jgi:hypothetical protein